MKKGLICLNRYQLVSIRQDLPQLNPLRSCVMTKDESLSCCTKDEGWPLGFGNQILGSNHPMRHLLRVIVVSDREKAERICQVSSEEMNANEPLMRCRYG